MKITFVSLSVLLLVLFSAGSALTNDSYKIIFETMDCSGNTGFATVGLDEIYKLGNGDCSEPDNPGRKLKQLLVHDGSGSYTAYTLTRDEAKNVMRDMKEYMQARKGVLERSDSIIIGH